jgi:AraC-like DNA-binding protein
MHEPCVCLITQGAKRVVVGDETYEYDAQHYLLTAINLPTLVKIVSASPERPYLGIKLQLDLREISQMLIDSNLPAPVVQKPIRGMVTGEVTLPLLTTFQRLVGLLDEPQDIPMLAPMIQREIIYRLLTGDQGAHLRQVASTGSNSQQIAKVIDWLKSNFKQSLRVDELASLAHMSSSAFHHQFRAMTALSPLQYLKNLRLNEARRLMMMENLDAATAAFEVGYENPAQFSREYKRSFGSPPKQDITNIRQMMSTGFAPASTQGA